MQASKLESPSSEAWTRGAKVFSLALGMCALALSMLALVTHREDLKHTRRRLGTAGFADVNYIRASRRTTSKTTESDKLRLVFPAGLEGAGHHFLSASFETLYRNEPAWPEGPNPCTAASQLWGLSGPRLKDAGAYESGVENMKAELQRLADFAEESNVPGGMVMLMSHRREGHECIKCKVGMLSYPNFDGPEKVMNYADLTVAKEVAEQTGVDLRVVYLSRSAADIVIADVKHRHFAKTGSSPENMFTTYMQIILTNAGVLSAMLQEVGTEYVTCLRYDEINDKEHTSEVAKFISPSEQLGLSMSNAMVQSATFRQRKNPSVIEPYEQAFVARLQRALDLLDMTYCGRTWS